MAKKIFNVIVSIIFIMLLFGCIRNTARSYKYRRLCDQYREQLYTATDENRELADRIGRIAEITGRIKEEADANITDARSIIETVERLRTQIQELENICGGFDYNKYYQYWDNIYGLEQ